MLGIVEWCELSFLSCYRNQPHLLNGSHAKRFGPFSPGFPTFLIWKSIPRVSWKVFYFSVYSVLSTLICRLQILGWTVNKNVVINSSTHLWTHASIVLKQSVSMCFHLCMHKYIICKYISMFCIYLYSIYIKPMCKQFRGPLCYSYFLGQNLWASSKIGVESETRWEGALDAWVTKFSVVYYVQCTWIEKVHSQNAVL
jgi:hypothetical protein